VEKFEGILDHRSYSVDKTIIFEHFRKNEFQVYFSKPRDAEKNRDALETKKLA